MTDKKGLPDFPKLKKAICFEKILKRYGLLDNLKRNGDQLSGTCPLHQGEGKKSFSVNLDKNCFNCFSCKAHGNILDFVSAMENVDLKEAGLLLSDWFNIPLLAGKFTQKSSQGDETASKAAQKERPLVREGKEEGDSTGAPSGSSSVINPPLTFELKNLDAKHPYLKDRGLEPETIKLFGLGFCSKGLMKGRIVIPIHNEKGELVAYAGRWPGDDYPEDEGKYKLPPKFQKSHLVFNLQRVKELIRERELILVEGYFSVFTLWQAGCPCVVALMGSAMSCEQEELIAEAMGPGGKVILLFDNDEAGLKCRQEVMERLIRRCFVKVMELPKGISQIDQMEGQEIKDLLASTIAL